MYKPTNLPLPSTRYSTPCVDVLYGKTITLPKHLDVWISRSLLFLRFIFLGAKSPRSHTLDIFGCPKLFSLCNSHQFTIKYGIFMSVCCFKCLIPYHRIPPVLNDAAVARFAKASRWHVGAFRVGGAIHGATGPWKRCIYGAMQLGWGRTKTWWVNVF